MNTPKNDPAAPGLIRALTEQEIRLNCVALAVAATNYTRGRVADPLTVADEFYAYVTGGNLPKAAHVQTGAATPLVADGAYSHGGPPNDEATGDMLKVNPPPHQPTASASLQQARRAT
jgi:hypothetical protein